MISYQGKMAISLGKTTKTPRKIKMAEIALQVANRRESRPPVYLDYQV